MKKWLIVIWLVAWAIYFSFHERREDTDSDDHTHTVQDGAVQEVGRSGVGVKERCKFIELHQPIKSCATM